MRGCALAKLPIFGRVPLGTAGGQVVYPSEEFQAFLKALRDALNGITPMVTLGDLETALGAPVGVVSPEIVSIGPVSVTATSEPHIEPVSVGVVDCFSGDPV